MDNQDLKKKYAKIFGQSHFLLCLWKKPRDFIIKTMDDKINELVITSYQKYLFRAPSKEELSILVNDINMLKVTRLNILEAIKTLEKKKCDTKPLIQDKVVLLNSLVDKIYLINLDKRQDKLKKVSKRLEKLGISYERFAAVDGSNQNIVKEYQQQRSKGSRITSVGAFGCLLSHLEIIKQAKQQKLKRILIFEDDVIFHKNFKNDLAKLSQIPDDWEILYLGVSQQNNTMSKLFVYRDYYLASSSYGTFAYIIKDTFYDKLIHELDKKLLNIDYTLVNLQKNYRFYVLYENLVIADLSSSDTVNGHTTINMSDSNKKMLINMFKWNMLKYDVDDT